MRRKIFITLSAAVFLLEITKLSFAMMCSSKGHSDKMHLAQAYTEHEHGVKETSEKTVLEKAVSVGNKICPVSGEEIKDDEKYQVEHEGKIYNLCCKMCLKDFKKDPKKYIEKLEQMEEEKEPQEKHQGHSEHPKGHHE